MGNLTTHVLDTSSGCPGEGIKITLSRLASDGSMQTLSSAITNADGRVDGPILTGVDFKPGTYQMEFSAGDYFRARGTSLTDPAFLDVVPIRFGISDADAHCHVPLLISPYGYSTYRGS